MRTVLLLATLTLGCGQLGDTLQSSADCMLLGQDCRAPEPVDGTDGRDGIDGRVGPRGEVGPVGQTGEQGNVGTSCSAEQVSNGAIITCGDSIVLISNGVNGLDGSDGADGMDGADAPPTPYTVTELIDPCGDQSGFDEVLLRLANGQLIAHFAQGSKQFLSSIGPGTYQTTDGHACIFVVHPDMSVTY